MNWLFTAKVTQLLFFLSLLTLISSLRSEESGAAGTVASAAALRRRTPRFGIGATVNKDPSSIHLVASSTLASGGAGQAPISRVGAPRTGGGIVREGEISSAAASSTATAVTQSGGGGGTTSTAGPPSLDADAASATAGGDSDGAVVETPSSQEGVVEEAASSWVSSMPRAGRTGLSSSAKASATSFTVSDISIGSSSAAVPGVKVWPKSSQHLLLDTSPSAQMKIKQDKSSPGEHSYRINRILPEDKNNKDKKGGAAGGAINNQNGGEYAYVNVDEWEDKRGCFAEDIEATRASLGYLNSTLATVRERKRVYDEDEQMRLGLCQGHCINDNGACQSPPVSRGPSRTDLSYFSLSLLRVYAYLSFPFLSFGQTASAVCVVTQDRALPIL